MLDQRTLVASFLPDSRAAEQAAPSHILVVDDLPQNLTAIEAALEGLGHRLVAVQSAKEALGQLLKQEFALILLDVQMPNINGFETARLIRARERTRHVPIIFMTAYSAAQADLLEAYGLLAVDFLFKPLKPEILRAKAAVFVALDQRRREALNQAEQIREHVANQRQSWSAEQRVRLEAESLKQRLDEQRERAAELEELNRRLEEQDRRKDEFLAVLGHELRNPLAPLLNGLDLIRGSASETVASTCAVMRRQVDHMVRQVDDLLDMSRVSRGKIQLRCVPIRAGDLLERAVALVMPQITRHGHELEIVCNDSGALVLADEIRMIQVLANLLSNAARYTEPGGSIRLGCSADLAGVTFSVTDNGRGISAEYVGRIFELFVQERAGGGGLGIGLALAKELVALHAGRITAKSDGVGRGSCFTVWLPGCPEHLTCAPPSTRPASLGRTSRAVNVVVVDDNEDARTLLAELFASWGHVVHSAARGADGVALVLSQRPDIAFIDIGLPDVDGYEVARQIRARPGSRAPTLVALSGFGQASDRQRASNAGFDRHLTKPASAKELERLLADVAKEAAPS